MRTAAPLDACPAPEDLVGQPRGTPASRPARHPSGDVRTPGRTIRIEPRQDSPDSATDLEVDPSRSRSAAVSRLDVPAARRGGQTDESWPRESPSQSSQIGLGLGSALTAASPFGDRLGHRQTSRPSQVATAQLNPVQNQGSATRGDDERDVGRRAHQSASRRIQISLA
jgi:hypothetical protein